MIRSIVGSILALTLAVSVAEAQVIGFKGGLNISTAVGDVPDEFSSRTTFGFGGFAIFQRTQQLGLQIEALYMSKGVEAEFEGADLELRLNYIEIPILVRYAIGGAAGGVTPHLFAGPAPAFKASCKLRGSEGGISVSANCDDVGIDVRSFDLGLVVGGGVSVPLGRAALIFDARANFGVLNISDNDEGESTRNRVFSFMGGVAIPLGQ